MVKFFNNLDFKLEFFLLLVISLFFRYIRDTMNSFSYFSVSA